MSSGSNGNGLAGRGPRKAELASALLSVKSLVSIVMGLALTNTILTAVTERGEDGRIAAVVSVLDLELQAILCTLAVITAIVRFYHGNNQLLESLYGETAQASEQAHPSRGIGVNFIVIMAQAVFFALMSFHVDGSRELIALFGLLLLLDIFWYVANQTTTDGDPVALRQQQLWMYNNLGFLVVLAALFYTESSDWAVTAGAVAILLNTAVDFLISWGFYFPALRTHDGEGGAATD